jgi:hypothetical protein
MGRMVLSDEMMRRSDSKLVKPYLYSDLGPGHQTGGGLQPATACARG